MTPLLDVNVLVTAHRGEQPDHPSIHGYLDALRRGQSSFGIPELVLSGFVRIVTAPKPFARPSTTNEAFDFAASVLASPRCLLVRPTETHWRMFDTLARAMQA